MGSLFSSKTPQTTDPTPLPVVDDVATKRQAETNEAKRGAAGRAGTTLTGASNNSLGTQGGAGAAGMTKTTLG
jgi:hypothetical protein